MVCYVFRGSFGVRIGSTNQFADDLLCTFRGETILQECSDVTSEKVTTTETNMTRESTKGQIGTLGVHRGHYSTGTGKFGEKHEN